MDEFESVSVNNYSSSYKPITPHRSNGLSSIFSLFLFILLVVSFWKIFVKAKKPGWASLIPIYGSIVWFNVAQMSGWCVLLIIVPFVNLYIGIKCTINIAKAFGKSTDFMLGMIFLPYIFYPILAFDKSQYLSSESLSSTPSLPPQPPETTTNTPILPPINIAPPSGFKAYDKPENPTVLTPPIIPEPPVITPPLEDTPPDVL